MNNATFDDVLGFGITAVIAMLSFIFMISMMQTYDTIKEQVACAIVSMFMFGVAILMSKHTITSYKEWKKNNDD